MIDQWGRPHPLGERANLIGRSTAAQLAILERSVSTEHAIIELHGGRWRLRDQGSRNGTTLDGQRAEGRAYLQSGDALGFGEVSFYFVAGRELPALGAPAHAETADASAAHATRLTLTHRENPRTIVLITQTARTTEPRIGLALACDHADADWADLALSPMEFELLSVLAERCAETRTEPSTYARCVSSRELARALPFQSAYPSDENVRQLVRRLRKSLARFGVEDLIDTVQGRGYLVTWQASAGEVAEADESR